MFEDTELFSQGLWEPRTTGTIVAMAAWIRSFSSVHPQVPREMVALSRMVITMVALEWPQAFVNKPLVLHHVTFLRGPIDTVTALEGLLPGVSACMRRQGTHVGRPEIALLAPIWLLTGVHPQVLRKGALEPRAVITQLAN